MVPASDIARLRGLLEAGGVLVLTGAGVSTDSGIPDYRGATGAARRHRPMTFREFTHDPAARHRYWARSYAGWPLMSQARPNATHEAIAHWEARGLVSAVVTQNVDRLHTAAGSRDVIDLHGRLDEVICLSCSSIESRASVQERLDAVNGGIDWDFSAWFRSSDRDAQRPDGDAELTPEQVASFRMVDCVPCGGDLKPDVVYFGESVPKDRVNHAYRHVDDARSLLVMGSSLHVYSGRRFVMRAAERGIPIAIINVGQTRADDLATIRIDMNLANVIDELDLQPTEGSADVDPRAVPTR